MKPSTKALIREQWRHAWWVFVLPLAVAPMLDMLAVVCYRPHTDFTPFDAHYLREVFRTIATHAQDGPIDWGDVAPACDFMQWVALLGMAFLVAWGVGDEECDLLCFPRLVFIKPMTTGQIITPFLAARIAGIAAVSLTILGIHRLLLREDTAMGVASTLLLAISAYLVLQACFWGFSVDRIVLFCLVATLIAFTEWLLPFNLMNLLREYALVVFIASAVVSVGAIHVGISAARHGATDRRRFGGGKPLAREDTLERAIEFTAAGVREIVPYPETLEPFLSPHEALVHYERRRKGPLLLSWLLIGGLGLTMLSIRSVDAFYFFPLVLLIGLGAASVVFGTGAEFLFHKPSETIRFLRMRPITTEKLANEFMRCAAWRLAPIAIIVALGFFTWAGKMPLHTRAALALGAALWLWGLYWRLPGLFTSDPLITIGFLVAMAAAAVDSLAWPFLQDAAEMLWGALAILMAYKQFRFTYERGIVTDRRGPWALGAWLLLCALAWLLAPPMALPRFVLICGFLTVIVTPFAIVPIRIHRLRHSAPEEPETLTEALS